MTTADLVALYRLMADDRVESARLVDADVQMLLLEGETEAAIRGRLIHDTISMTVTAGQSSYYMPDEFYEIAHLAFIDADGARHPLKLVTSEYLDPLELSRIIPPQGSGYDLPQNLDNWRDAIGHPPLFAVQTDTQLRLAPIPSASGTLALEGYRTPLREADDDPEIAAAHHAYLVQWVIHRRFSITDEDHFDGKRAEIALNEFTRYFGPRPDSDLRRATRHDTPHHVEAFFV